VLRPERYRVDSSATRVNSKAALLNIHLFFNPVAAEGRSAMRLGATLATFRTLGAKVVLHRPDSAESARAQMYELAGDTERIVVVGGDGMVHQAANALVGSTTVLGIIPAGTGNDAATSLGLSNDIDDACRAALRDPLAIDLIDSAAGVAVTVATAGFSVLVNDRANQMKRIKGRAKYTISSLIELPKLRCHRLTMVLDGVEHRIDANLIAIANTQYFGGGMKIAPEAQVNDGQLDVVVVGPAPRVAFAAVLPTVFSGRHIGSRYVTTHRASKVELAGSDMDLRADGESYGSVPTTLTVRERALLVAGATVS
jgi:diacylglycerol kinase (ATP)